MAPLRMRVWLTVILIFLSLILLWLIQDKDRERREHVQLPSVEDSPIRHTTSSQAVAWPEEHPADISTSTLKALEKTSVPVIQIASTTEALSSTSTLASTSTPQFVVLAFDGSQSLNMWQETRQFAKDLTAQNKPLHFTYFISGVYLLKPSAKDLYLPPQHATGTSAIGFGWSARDVANRVEQINLASQEGHEIGSHANGHFTGVKWSKEDWTSEFDQFNQFVTQVEANNGLQKEPLIRKHIQAHISGFRAPELGVSDGLWPVLKDRAFRYDTSRIAKATDWPKKNAFGTWEFPLAKINFATSTSQILSMDYNFYFKQTGAKDLYKKGTPEWTYLYDQMYMSYQNYFTKNYLGNRAPVFIGHHFSTWNDGVYWEALKAFAADVCGKPEVRCVTFSELADYLDKK
jgi:hypothetical protein